MVTELSSVALARGVPPGAVAATLQRRPGRLAIVAALLGSPVAAVQRRVDELVAQGLQSDAALDWLVLDG